MDPRFVSAMSQWFMYFLPTFVAWIRVRMGEKTSCVARVILFLALRRNPMNRKRAWVL